MEQPWTRDCTKEWISQVENRIEDFTHYLYRTKIWCEENNVYDENLIFACKIVTITWVGYMREELVSKREAFEMVGVTDWYKADDGIYELGPKFQDMELEEILEEIIYNPW